MTTVAEQLTAVGMPPAQAMALADAGMLSDVPQTITAVKTFSGANVHSGAETHSGVETHSGAETHSGVEVFSTMFRIPVAAVNAAGTNLATATQIVGGLSVVALADDTVGVKLPATPAAGTVCLIKSTVANKILKVYPDAAATINAIGSNGAISLASGPTPVILVASSATQWYTFPLLPS